MPSDFETTFAKLRSILDKHSRTLAVHQDTSACYSLAGKPGAATLKAWGGKLKQPIIPVAWVQVGKAYVSYHLMGVHGNAKLQNAMSKELKARMQGKTCFNFKAIDEALLVELDELTAQSIAAFRNAGFIAN